MSLQTRFTHTDSTYGVKNLHPNYIAGFIDGEGSFNITVSLQSFLSTPLSGVTRCPVIKNGFYQVRSSHNQSSNSNDISRYSVR